MHKKKKEKRKKERKKEDNEEMPVTFSVQLILQNNQRKKTFLEFLRKVNNKQNI